MDIHDGSFTQWQPDGPYYWYGMGYSNCTLSRIYMPPQYCKGVYEPMGDGCGFRIDHPLSVYSSRDLVRWTFEGDALPMNLRPRGVYFRPKVIFDARTNEYVLWVNYLRQQGTHWPQNTPLQSYISNISTLVAKSKSPTGPFRLATPSRVMRNLQVGGVGDFALLVDNGGSSAYIAYDAWDNGHRVRIEQLNKEWTASLPGAAATTGDLSAAGVEAPILFERRGWYYLIYGSTCCFCAEGGSATVQVARHPLGPWAPLGVDLNKWNTRTHCGRAVPSQNNYVAQVATSSGELEYLFMGDLWTSAPDGLKSHDLQYWAPLKFDDDASPPTIAPLVWIDGFEIDVAGAAPSAVAPVGSGVFGPGSARAKIMANRGSCSHNGTFEAWLLALIVAGAGALVAACALCCCLAQARSRRGMLPGEKELT